MTVSHYILRAFATALICCAIQSSLAIAQDDLQSAIKQRLIGLSQPNGNKIARDAVVAVSFIDALSRMKILTGNSNKHLSQKISKFLKNRYRNPKQKTL